MKKLYYIIACLFLIIATSISVKAQEQGQEWEWYSEDRVEISTEKNLCFLSADFKINGSGYKCKDYFLLIPEDIFGAPKLIFKYETEGGLKFIGYPLLTNILVILDEEKTIPTIQFIYDPAEGFDSEGYYILRPVSVILRVTPKMYRSAFCLRPINIVERSDTNNFVKK